MSNYSRYVPPSQRANKKKTVNPLDPSFFPTLDGKKPKKNLEQQTVVEPEFLNVLTTEEPVEKKKEPYEGWAIMTPQKKLETKNAVEEEPEFRDIANTIIHKHNEHTRKYIDTYGFDRWEKTFKSYEWCEDLYSETSEEESETESENEVVDDIGGLIGKKYDI